MDSGVENTNSAVTALVESGTLRRILAQVDVVFSNSMIEAWWRMLKHQWLYLNELDSRMSWHAARLDSGGSYGLVELVIKKQSPNYGLAIQLRMSVPSVAFQSRTSPFMAPPAIRFVPAWKAAEITQS